MEINTEVINKYYVFLIKRVKFYEDDYDATEKALKDRRIDYITKTEYKNDLSDDSQEISRLNGVLSELMSYAKDNNIIINTDIKDKINEINISGINEMMIKELLDNYKKELSLEKGKTLVKSNN